MRLTFEELSGLQARLLDRLIQRQIDVETYIVEWDGLVEFAGWSWSEVVDEIDRGWFIDRVPRPVFLC